MIPEEHPEDSYPINNSLQGFGRGLFVSTSEIDGIIANSLEKQDELANPLEENGVPRLADINFLNGKFSTLTAIDGSSVTSNVESSKNVQQFLEEVNSATSLAMRKQLSRMVERVSRIFPERTNFFSQEMENFHDLFCRYLDQKCKPPLDWNKVESAGNEKIIGYQSIDRSDSRVANSSLNRLAVLKLNGGLGTTMGCVGPKSAIEVREHMTFLDLTVRQIEHLNTSNDGIDVPLILMNSFNTDSKTRTILQKYSRHKVSIVTFNQSRFPRINSESLMPVVCESIANNGKNISPTGRYRRASSPSSVESGKDGSDIDDPAAWYPPGHGDLYSSLDQSGLLNDLLANGKEILFISNIDNLGATVDTNILEYMLREGIEFVMEVTDKTRNDIKGGTLIQYDGQIKLLEIAQVPQEHVKDFTTVKKFKIFNTNNIWINLKALRKQLDQKALRLEVIENLKMMEGTEQRVIQLETAIGSAIGHFEKSVGINVPRSRFLPVKSTSDLFLAQSDLYSLSHGRLTMTPQTLSKRPFNIIPTIKLGDHFKVVKSYLERVGKGVPSLVECDHLTVSGDVTFGSNVSLKGTVIIVANHGNHIDIPNGSVINDKVISGNLHILDH